MARIVIGITGYARSGKDTVADRLVAEHGFTKMSMAGPLKAMARTLNPIIGTGPGGVELDLSTALADLPEDKLKASEYGAEYRRLLQVLGTDCIRAIDPDFWVKAMQKAIEESPAERIVIPDVRFPNEFRLVTDLYMTDAEFAELWRVSRKAAKPHGGELLHESELYVETAPAWMTFHNDGTLDDLYESVDFEAAQVNAAAGIPKVFA